MIIVVRHSGGTFANMLTHQRHCLIIKDLECLGRAIREQSQ